MGEKTRALILPLRGKKEVELALSCPWHTETIALNCHCPQNNGRNAVARGFGETPIPFSQAVAEVRARNLVSEIEQQTFLGHNAQGKLLVKQTRMSPKRAAALLGLAGAAALTAWVLLRDERVVLKLIFDRTREDKK